MPRKPKQNKEIIRNIALFPEENPFPVLRVDEGGVLLYANRASGDLLKCWTTSVGGKVPGSVFLELETALKKGVNGELETRCGNRIFSLALVPIVERGYVNFYGRDVTEQKGIESELVRGEESLRKAQEIARLGSWELNLGENRLTWSDEVYRIFGFHPQEFGASYEAFLEAVHPDDRDAVNEAYLGSLREGGNSYEIEHRIVQKSSGEIRYVHEKCEHLKDEDGKIIRSLGMVHDITERRTREKEIERLNADLKARAEELESANRELKAFNYMVAHDLRKPLTVIHGYSEILRKLCGEKFDGQHADFLRRISENTFKMSDLIDTLLNFSSMEHAVPDLEPVNLSDLAKKAAEELMQAEPERRVAFRIEEGVIVDGDPDLLGVAMTNLLGNAWKYSVNQNEAVIEFGISKVNGRSNYFIRDNGIGFDMEDADNLFLPFKRSPNSGEISGFGIGLSTVQRIILNHGGKIWAEGEPGNGATFYFALKPRNQDLVET